MLHLTDENTVGHKWKSIFCEVDSLGILSFVRLQVIDIEDILLQLSGRNGPQTPHSLPIVNLTEPTEFKFGPVERVAYYRLSVDR